MKRTLVRGLIALIVGMQVLAPGGADEASAQASPAAVGYRAEDVRIDTGAASLAATLLIPDAAGPLPAVVYVPGSGPANRQTTMMGRLEGEFLAARGVAVLRYDKRGVGGSTGNWKRETFQERADDVIAMVRYLQALSWVDAGRVGLIGHSQGAYVATLAVSQSSEIAFVVMLAGPGTTVKEQTLAYERREMLLAGIPDEQVDRRVARLGRWLDLSSRLGPVCQALRLHYICHVVDYDPIPALEAVRVPVLAAFGELDTQVPPDPNAEQVAATLRRAGNRDYTIKVYPRANHWFMEARTGSTHEAVHGGLRHAFVPGLLEDIGAWIAERFTAR